VCSHLGKYAVWIDGLSINQEDLDDKAVQVSQMHSVYTHANMTMAVMSSPTSDTDFLFDRQNWTSECISKKHNRLHKTLLDVLANDYWRRTWILQEIVLGNVCTYQARDEELNLILERTSYSAVASALSLLKNYFRWPIAWKRMTVWLIFFAELRGCRGQS
jgi:hypothetical protein